MARLLMIIVGIILAFWLLGFIFKAVFNLLMIGLVIAAAVFFFKMFSRR